MNNKGFTLVELLAVILILIGIASVSIFNISSSLNKNEKQKCDKQAELIKNAAKIYFSLNEDKSSVSISTLINGDYFKSEDVDLYNGNGVSVNTEYEISGSSKC